MLTAYRLRRRQEPAGLPVLHTPHKNLDTYYCGSTIRLGYNFYAFLGNKKSGILWLSLGLAPLSTETRHSGPVRFLDFSFTFIPACAPQWLPHLYLNTHRQRIRGIMGGLYPAVCTLDLGPPASSLNLEVDPTVNAATASTLSMFPWIRLTVQSSAGMVLLERQPSGARFAVTQNCSCLTPTA